MQPFAILTLAATCLCCAVSPPLLAVFTHEPSGFAFPREIGGFKRGEVTEFDAAAHDVSVGYSLSGHPAEITVYVFPAPDLPDGTVISFEQHFAAEASGILDKWPGAQQIAWPESVVTANTQALQSRQIAFVVPRSRVGAPYDAMSLLQLFDYGAWRLKFRTTFLMADPVIMSRVQGFNRQFPWPRRTK